MDHIAFAYPRIELFFKAFERIDRILLARLYLDRDHFVFQLAVIGYEKVYLYIVAVLLCVVLRVEVQLVTVGGEHLSDSVLIEHIMLMPHSHNAQVLIHLIIPECAGL